MDPRLQIAWAAGLLVAAATTHTGPPGAVLEQALEWLAEPELLATGICGSGRTFRVGLRISSFSCVLLDGVGRPLEEFALDRRTLADVKRWLEDAIARHRNEKPLRLRSVDLALPSHPVGGGRVFEIGAADACLELARWYAGADVVLRELAAATAGASAVRCRSERLELGTSIPVSAARRSESSQSAIAVGMCPGDSSFREPYWYVALPAAAPERALPPLGHDAEWNVGAWVGAVLHARKLVRGSAAGQRERLTAFLREAVTAAQELVRDAA
jgi:hypothetical protein